MTATPIGIAATIVARKSDGSQRAFFRRAALVYAASGTAYLQGSVVDMGTVKSDSTWDATIIVDSSSGAKALVRVQGAASTTVYWVVTVEYQAVSSSS